ncbi:MAG: hypothetical protein LBE13_22305, partial [Bacteroidales bacterium]|nr:hypothetical protein [Bacteroidales bacterium]
QCSEPKETNRQIGPMFKEWLRKKTLGIELVNLETFTANNPISEGIKMHSLPTLSTLLKVQM